MSIGFIIELFLHLDKYLNLVFAQYNIAAYFLLFLIIFMAIFLSCLPTLLPTCGCSAKQASYEPQPAGGAKKKSCSRLLGKG